MPSPALAPRHWWVHALALVLVVSAGLLGWWQLEAWQERRAAEAVDLTDLTPVPLADVFDADEAFLETALGRPVEITGTWRTADTFWVDAPDDGDNTTSWAVTPVTVAGTGSVLPVVRGSHTANAVLPEDPEGEVTLVARLQPSDQVVSIPEVAQQIDADLYSGYAVAQAGQPGTEGLAEVTLEQLPAPSRFTALRNLLYALEWWVFGLFAAVVWWRHVRDVASGLAEDEPAGAAEQDEPAEEDEQDHVVPSEP